MVDNDITAIFYTSNHMEGHFIESVKEQLVRALDGIPLISVSQKEMDFGENICVGDVGRSHLNIYRQILIGCQAATTKYVAMTEDDILYSAEHFREKRPDPGHFLYDMHKWSIFTWSKPAIFSLRRRKIVNHLIAERQMLIDAMQERFDKFDCLEFGSGQGTLQKLGYWGDPGRQENILKVTHRPVQEFYASVPGIVFSHPGAYGYTSRGERKSLAREKTYELRHWGTAERILKDYYHE
jgi:hypothetical protein